jgi:tetratricopeptide (TPR) repeat protein
LQSSAVEEAKHQMAELEKLKARELEKGHNHLKEKDYQEAEKVFNRLIKTFKEDTDLKITISNMYMEEGMLEEALKYIREAYKEDPEAIHVLNKMGIALRKAKKFDLAIKAFKEAISKSPDDEFLFFNLGRVYIDVKHWEDVQRVAQRALSLNPNFLQAEKMLEYAKKMLH